MADRSFDAIGQPEKRRFLIAYARKGTIRAAADAAGISRQTYYNWSEQDGEFATAAGIAKAEYADRLEEKLSRLAVDKSNVTALIVALKIAGRYTEKAEVSGPGG